MILLHYSSYYKRWTRIKIRQGTLNKFLGMPRIQKEGENSLEYQVFSPRDSFSSGIFAEQGRDIRPTLSERAPAKTAEGWATVKSSAPNDHANWGPDSPIVISQQMIFINSVA